MTDRCADCVQMLHEIQSFAEMIIATQVTMADAHKALIQQIIDAAKAALRADRTGAHRMNPNTVLITRTLDAHESERLRDKLRELWPAESFTIIHGQVLTAADIHRMMTGPSEVKENVTMTPMPRWDSVGYYD